MPLEKGSLDEKFLDLPIIARTVNWYPERAFSKLKAYLREIAERTVAGLMGAFDASADIFKSVHRPVVDPRHRKPSRDGNEGVRSPHDVVRM